MSHKHEEQVMGWRVAFMFVACASFWLAQEPAPEIILTIDWENNVTYLRDTIDPAKLARDPNITPALPALVSFLEGVTIGDTVAVNGRPAKGNHVYRITFFITAGAGGAIADITRNAIADGVHEFQRPDGTTFGSIMLHGLNGGGPPIRPPATGVTTG